MGVFVQGLFGLLTYKLSIHPLRVFILDLYTCVQFRAGRRECAHYVKVNLPNYLQLFPLNILDSLCEIVNINTRL